MKSLYEMYFKYKKINNLKIKEIPHENSKPKKAGVVILMLNKADFNAEENGWRRIFKMIKGIIDDNNPNYVCTE